MRKNIALILALVMILSLIPMSAFAASTNTVNRVPVVTRNADLRADNILRIANKDGSFQLSTTTEVFELELGAGATWLPQMETQVLAGVDIQVLAGEKIAVVRVDDIAADFVTDPILIELWVDFDGAPSGEQTLRVWGLESPISDSTVVYAIVEAGATVATATRGTLRDRGPETVGSIRIQETVSGTVTGTQEFRLRLPRNFFWNEAWVNLGTANALISFSGFGAGATVTNVELSNSDRDMTITTNNLTEGVSRGTITIQPNIGADRNAPFGEVAVSLTGRNNISSASGLVIANYVDYGYTIDSDTVDDEFVTGIVDDYVAQITIEETVANSLMRNRFVDVDLPSWVKIVNGTDITVNDEVVATADTDTSSFEFRVTQALIDADADGDLVIEFEFTIAGNAAEAGPREMMVSITGAGMDDEVSIGTAIPAISVEVVGERVVQIGLQRQLVPEIIITENFAGALRESNLETEDGELTITPGGLFPESARFDSFSVEVLEGDIELGSTSDGDNIGIEIDAESEVASVIRIYDIRMTLDRTVPMGGFRVDVGGTAVLDDLNVAHADCPSRVARLTDFFEVGTPVVDVDDLVQVAFTVGQMAYWVDGEMQMMDVAPFISEGRIMVPVRYMEELFGMQPIWNPTARTVTVMYNNQVFEMTIGSNMLRVNGAPFMEMDAEAVIVDSRTFVPLSRFARAMNIPYVWDAATQTVTFN